MPMRVGMVDGIECRLLLNSQDGGAFMQHRRAITGKMTLLRRTAASWRHAPHTERNRGERAPTT